MRFVSVGLAVLMVVFGSAASMAATKNATRQAREKAAQKACITGDFRKGVDILGDLFVETQEVNYVYNQGRCFEQNHRWEEAIDRFREYLRKEPHLQTADKADVENHISECEAQQAKLAPQPPTPIVTPARIVVPAPPAPPPAPAAAPVELTASPGATEPRSGTGLRTAGIVTAAVGLAALGGGLVFNLQANSLTNQLNGSTWDRDKASRHDTYQTLGWIAYGVGAAALVTGTALVIAGWPSGRTADTPPALSLIPVVVPGITALSLQGNFQ